MLMPALGGKARRKYEGRDVSDLRGRIRRCSPGRRMVGNCCSRRAENGRWRRAKLRPAPLDASRRAKWRTWASPNEPLHYDTSPAVSPDGQWLAFTRYTRTQRLNQIMLQRLGPGFVAGRVHRQPVPNLEADIHHSLHWGADQRHGFGSATAGRSSSGRSTALPRRDPHARAALLEPSMMSIVRACDGRTRRRRRRCAPTRTCLRCPSILSHTARSGDAGGSRAVIGRRTNIRAFHRTARRWRSSAIGAAPRDIWLANRDGTNPRQLTRRWPSHRGLSALVAG